MSQSALSNQRSAISDQRSAINNRLWLMVGVLLIASAFRFLAIDAAPPGWRDDELIEYDVDRRIADGWRPLFITEAEGHEPVYHYLHAGTLLLFGDNIMGYRWLPFAFGLLAISLTYAFARKMFGVRVALLAAALIAVSFWPIMYARFGVRHIGTLPWMLGAFYLLYPSPRPSPHRGEGVSLREWVANESHVIVAGVLLSAALMTYFAGRALPVILLGFLIYLALLHRSIFKRVWRQYLLAIVVAVLIALPMFIQIADTPGAEKRTEVVGGPLIELSKGHLRPAIETTLGTFGMFTFAGDPESLYNVSGRPVFDWLTGAFFYLGVIICLVRLRRLESGFALIWLIIGIAPAFVSLPAASFSHTIAAQPVVFVVTAAGAVEVASLIGTWIGGRRDRENAGMREREKKRISPSRHLSIALSLLLIFISSVLTLRDYFGTWAHDEFVRFQYHAPTRDIAKWLDQHPEITDVAIGTHPNELTLDPMALHLDLKREDVKVRWFNAESALVLSHAHHSVILLSLMQSPGEIVLRRLAESTKLVQRYDAFDVYDVMPLIGVFPPPGGAFGQGSLVLLGGTQPFGSKARPGQLIKWGMVWRVGNPLSSSRLKIFLHVLNDKKQIIAGDDREDINFSTLQVGDDFQQAGQLTLPTGLSLGHYQVEVGWYNPETGERLKLADGSDRLLLEPIEVTAR